MLKDSGSRGFGPFWAALIVNRAPKAKAKTAIIYHSDVKLYIDVRNDAERGQSLWTALAMIGPFDSERAVIGMVGAWTRTAKKEREARLLSAPAMHRAYANSYPGLTLLLAVEPSDGSSVGAEETAQFNRDKIRAIQRKRARRSNRKSVANRMHDTAPVMDQLTYYGDVRSRRVQREKDREAAEQEESKRQRT